MTHHPRALPLLVSTALLALALGAAGCSFRNANQTSCTTDAECAAAFGAGAVCRSDGFCAAGGDDTDAAGDGDGNTGTDGGTDGGDDMEPWTFVSFPDFLNADIGDVSALTTAVNSTNAAHEAAIATVLDALAAEQPDFVMVAGDLVNGHWYADAAGVRVFGPVGTLAEKRAAVTAASDLYYAQWNERFASRGLEVYAALGDHDVGDNNWPANQDKAFLVSTYKQQWAKHFTLDQNGAPRFPLRPTGTPYEHTAYAVRHKNVLVVTVDVFRQDDPTATIDSRTGSVRNDVVGEQLAWLDQVLADAAIDPAIDHVIVQGHVPVLLPVRQLSSSGLSMPGGATSEFWQTLASRDVDLYFAGEVHDMSTANALGVEQVVHGGIMGYAPRVSYLVGRVFPDRIELELKSATLVYPSNDTTRLWQAGSNRPRAQYSVHADGFSTAGTLVIDKSSGATQYLNRTGYFVPLGATGSGLSVHLPFDELGGSTAVNHGNTGAINNGIVDGATFVAGKFGNALAFDELDEVVAGAPPVLGAASRTTSVWVRAAPTTTGIRSIFSFGINSGGGKWDTDIDGTGLYELGIGMNRTDATGSISIADNGWHHVATVLPMGVTSLASVQMFIDGEPIVFTQTATTPIDTRNGNILIGRSVNGSVPQHFFGTIDDFALWSEPLTIGQVRALHSLGREAALNYDASEVNAMFTSFELGQDVSISGRLWRYQATGLTGDLGVVTPSGSGYTLHIAGGAGFVSP